MRLRTIQYSIITPKMPCPTYLCRATDGEMSKTITIGIAIKRIGFHAIASPNRPLRTECIARKVPHPGHFKPVKARNGHRG